MLHEHDCSSTTFKILLNFKFMVHRSRSRKVLGVFFIQCLSLDGATFITARGSDWGYPRAVLSLEQDLTVLLFVSHGR